MGRKKRDNATTDLFIEESGQLRILNKSYEQQIAEKEPVECLGLTFESEEERREYFLEKLREKLRDPEFRQIEGFPIGSDEDILALSEPPYYTACPNPFIEDFIKHNGKPYDPENDPYRREPFAADVSEGKNDPIYNAHSYHTKVPHKAIMRYILHYTKPGDVVFDGFCGTGMTGVAAQLCGDKATVESLLYKVDEEGNIFSQNQDEKGKIVWNPISKLGARSIVLNDLSPVATFISYNYNSTVDARAFEREAKRILEITERECDWMYRTKDVHGNLGKINWTLWSDVFVCPECTKEVVFWDAAIDRTAGKVKDDFTCPHCNVNLTKRDTNHAWTTTYDNRIAMAAKQAKQLPVLINYSIGNKRYLKQPDASDLALIEKIQNSDIPYWVPTSQMPEGDKTSDPYNLGVSHSHHFYTKRNLWVIAAFWHRTLSSPFSHILQYCLTAALPELNRRTRLRVGAFFKGGRGPISAGVSGNLYLPSLSAEKRVTFGIANRIETVAHAILSKRGPYIITTESASTARIGKATVDYIFTDPPFGGNLMYSELNFLWESWLKVYTNRTPEALENKSQGKTLYDYQTLMTDCFRRYQEILKPGRWMTVEFHNSQNRVWSAIQEALQRAGFVVADVRTLDKKQGTFNQVAGGGSVKQDLVISAYKPNGGLEERFKLAAGTEEGVWEFIRTHLKQLPRFVSKNGQVEVVAERQNYLLFDRMVAFHIQRNVSVPLSAAEFYQGLVQRFPERDGMFFLPEQVAEYDKKRLTVREVLQTELFVKDEATAIHWLRQQLTKKPQTFQELHPQFLKEIGGWEKHEKPLELSDILDQNFLRYYGKQGVPSQIHSYLSTNFKEMRNLPKDDPILRAKAKDRWYVPDPSKAGDLEKLREKALLKEFEEYRQSKQKKIKVFRLEAVRTGFKKAWQTREYSTIIEVAKKIPENVLQEDSKLLMWYDQAVTRMGET
jgi:DNA modification methylase/rubredoxin